ncbi:unnamed protein product, partial [Ascophyllum nodosum]
QCGVKEGDYFLQEEKRALFLPGLTIDCTYARIAAASRTRSEPSSCIDCPLSSP